MLSPPKSSVELGSKMKGKGKCKPFVRNVQTQAQTRASVSPYADNSDGPIVLTGREDEEEEEEGHSCPES